MSVFPDVDIMCSVRHAADACSLRWALVRLGLGCAFLVILCAPAHSQDTLPIISSVTFEGRSAVSEGALRRLAEISEGSPLQQTVVERDVQAILAEYTELGFPFTAIRIVVHPDDSLTPPRAALVFSITEGPRVALREITVQGNSATQNDVITREARLRSGDMFSQSRLDRLRSRLDRLQLFSSVGDIQLYLLNDSSAGSPILRNGGLLCTVQEGNATTFDGVLGYVPGATAQESGYLTGAVSLVMKNVFGTGRKIAARWQRETAATQELELHYTEPWFLQLPLDIGAGYFQRKQDSLYVKNVLSLRGDYNLTDELTLSGTMNSESIYPSSNLQQFTVYESSSLFFGGEIKYDTRDNSRAPTSGLRYSTSYQSGTKKITGPAQFITQTDIKNYFTSRIAMDVDMYTMPWRRHVFALGVHGKQVTSSVIELSDMFPIGGSTTVRGYRESQFFGSRIAWTSLEYRYLTGRLSHVFTFIDAGYFSRPDQTSSGIAAQEKLLTGVGIGTRLETALGILGVSYALGKGDTFSTGKIHFGIVNEF